MPPASPSIASARTVCFLHVPKTAGRTLEAILERYYPADVTYDVYGEIPQAIARLRSLPIRAKRRLRLVKGHYGFGLHECLPQPVTYITFLRDPIERIISHYYYVRRDPTHPLHETLRARDMTLREYVTGGHSVELDNGQVRLLSGEEQAHAFGRCPARLLEQAKQNIERHFALVGLVERFDESLVLLQHIFGWTDVRYRKRNVTKNRTTQARIPQATLDAIWQHNQLDFKLHAYARRRLERALAQHGPALDRALGRLRRRNCRQRAQRWVHDSITDAGRRLMKVLGV